MQVYLLHEREGVTILFNVLILSIYSLIKINKFTGSMRFSDSAQIKGPYRQKLWLIYFKLYNIQTPSCFFDVVTLNVMKTCLLVYALVT